MSTISCTSLGFVPNGLIDAKTLGIRTSREGEYLQYFTASVTGLDLMARVRPETGEVSDRFWGAVALAAVEAIGGALRERAQSGTELAKRPIDAFELTIDLTRVDDLEQGPRALPSIQQGAELGPLEL